MEADEAKFTSPTNACLPENPWDFKSPGEEMFENGEKCAE
jgi:hypothetical protein